MKEKLYAILPKALAVVIFIFISAFYFAPQFEGKVLNMHDTQQYVASSQDIREFREEYGTDPQWEGRMFSGMPSYMIHFDFKTGAISTITSALHFLGNPAGYIFVYMLGFYLMLLLFGVNPWIGIIPSIAYGLSTYSLIIIGAGHLAKVLALGYAPMLVGAVYYAYRKNIWTGAVMTALFGALIISVNHPQIVYYFLFVLLALWINELVRALRERVVSRFVKATVVLVFAGLLALGANFSTLYYSSQYSKQTIRGGSELTSEGGGENKKGLDFEYATQWSYGKVESLNMLIPNLMGGASDYHFSPDGEVAQVLGRYNARELVRQLPTYWGDQPITSGPVYIGAVMLFFAVLGLSLLRGRYKWWVVSVSVLALLLSWGSNMKWFSELFFYYFPLYDKFRTVSMILVVLQWSAPFIAAIVLHKIYKGEFSKKETLVALKKSVYVVGGVTLVVALLGGMIFSFSSTIDSMMKLPADIIDAMRQERASMMRSDAMRSLLFVLLSAGVVWLFVAEKIKKMWFVVVLALLVIADMVPVGLRFMPQSKFTEKRDVQIKPSQANVDIMQDKSLGYRVADFSRSIFNDATSSYFHRSIGGYHGAKLQRYQDIIERFLSKNNMPAFNMLNTKYFIVPNSQTGAPEVQLNAGANGAAWFVDSVVYADSANEEIELLGKIDNKVTAVVESRFRDMIGELKESDDSASITLTDYKINHLTYTYSSAQPKVAVFSEIYYEDGWSAYLDGEPMDYFRADYILRGAYLPQGDHRVEFRFAAPSFTSVSMVTKVSIGAILALILVVIVVTIVKSNGKREQ